MEGECNLWEDYFINGIMRLVRFVCGCNIFSEQRVSHLAQLGVSNV